MSQDVLEGDVFVCPECHGAVPLTAGQEDALLEAGCVYCGADLSPEAVRRRG